MKTSKDSKFQILLTSRLVVCKTWFYLFCTNLRYPAPKEVTPIILTGLGGLGSSHARGPEIKKKLDIT